MNGIGAALQRQGKNFDRKQETICILANHCTKALAPRPEQIFISALTGWLFEN
jgi:hypothetical protein